MIEYISPRPRVELDQAATTLQKAYKGLRTRRSLADGAIVAEELWWKTVDSVYLNIKSISFFHEDRQETAASRWSRAGKRVAKVGKGLCKDDKAQKLALQHWLEAIDPRHRYTTSGARAPAASPSSTGWMSAKAETCITRNAHEASSTHSSSCTSDQYVRAEREGGVRSRRGGRPAAVQAKRRSGEHERGVQVDLRAEHQQVAVRRAEAQGQVPALELPVRGSHLGRRQAGRQGRRPQGDMALQRPLPPDRGELQGVHRLPGGQQRGSRQRQAMLGGRRRVPVVQEAGGGGPRRAAGSRGGPSPSGHRRSC
ncbi:Putative calmodulin-binding family protein [Zea mays]|nr:Putative calmodulin-binding family protein [Zea mays]